MALEFSAKEAKELLSSVQNMQRQHEKLINAFEIYRAEAEKQAKGMLGYRAFENLLRDEIVRGKEGVKAPRGSDALARDIVCCQKLKPISRYCKQMTEPRRAEVQANTKKLSETAGGLKRLFASSAKKQEAAKAYAALTELMNSDYAKYTEGMAADVEKIERITPVEAWEELQRNKDIYYKESKSALARVRSDTAIGEFEKLIERHNALTAPFAGAEKELDRSKDEIKRACDDFAMKGADEILREVPVEEVNRGKGGYRVKTLRDCGFNTMADIRSASPNRLAAVNGISPEGAVEIKKIADSLAEQSKGSVKIKLSTDNKTKESTALVQAICRYILISDSLSGYLKTTKEHSKNIERASETLRDVGNGVLWLFTPDSEKAAVKGAYGYLSQLLDSDYGNKLRQMSAVTGNISVTPARAWQHFADNTVRYYNVIEEFAPGMLGNDNGIYGLPEDLAHEIQNEPFYPEGLRCELRRYQEWGVKYALHQQRVLLGDEMGLGKTVQAIAVMVSLRNTGAERFVVVCPASVLSNWCREISKHSDLTVSMVHGTKKEAALNSWKQSGGVAVTTYETTGFFSDNYSSKLDMMVVDEAHYIKNTEARRSMNVRKLCAKSEKLLFMTGTAIENRVDEMISLIQVLRPEIAERVKSLAFMSGAPQFREAVAPVYYRRRREDVLTELPELTESFEWCTLGKEEEALYEQAIINQKYADARRVSWAVDDLALSSKARRLSELLDEAGDDGRKVIVFSFFLDTVNKISRMIGERCVGPINGSVPPQRRQEMIDEFDKAPEGAVLTAQIQSGGTGLNIQSASVIVICEPQFKPSIENQAISRAYRMGQSRNVLVYRLLCEDTVDEKITQLLKEKQAVFDAFADKSAVAEETLELDQQSFGGIMQDEYKRITEKVG